MSPEINRNILIAVDASENSRRAVKYVGNLLGDIKGFKATLLHVIREPEEDEFPDPGEKDKWYQEHRRHVNRMLAEYRGMLMDAGFEDANVSTRSSLRYCPSMAECILAEMDSLEYATLVVGRRGLSLKEEFLFGSISNKIVRIARNCAVWVVE